MIKMNEEEINYWCDVFERYKQAFKSSDGKQISFCKILKEYKQLQNNWNDLKKWLGTRINTDKDYERNSHIKEKLQVEDYVIKQVMLFMQELEGNNE